MNSGQTDSENPNKEAEKYFQELITPPSEHGLTITLTNEMLEEAVKRYKETHPHWCLYPITNEYHISRGEVIPKITPIKDIIKSFLAEANRVGVVPSRFYTALLEYLEDEYFEPE